MNVRKPLTVTLNHIILCLHPLFTIGGSRGLQSGSLTRPTRDSLQVKVSISLYHTVGLSPRPIYQTRPAWDNRIQQGSHHVSICKQFQNNSHNLVEFRPCSKDGNLGPNVLRQTSQLLANGSHHIQQCYQDKRIQTPKVFIHLLRPFVWMAKSSI